MRCSSHFELPLNFATKIYFLTCRLAVRTVTLLVVERLKIDEINIYFPYI